MKDTRAITLEEWNGSYLRRLAPFLGISVVLHVVIIALFIGIALLFGGGRGIEVQLFQAGSDEAPLPSQPLLAGFGGPERVKIFRIDFFREIIPWQPPEPEPVIEEPEVVEPEPEPEVVEPEPVEETPEEPEEQVAEEEPTPEEVAEEAPEEATIAEEEVEKPELLQHPRTLFGMQPEVDIETAPPKPGFPTENGPEPLLEQPDIEGEVSEEEELPDALGIFPNEEEGEVSGEPDFEVRTFRLPEWDETDMNSVEWTSDLFLGNYTIYMMADISRRHGDEDLLVWNYVLRKLITNPHAAYPPNVVTVATALENPYAWDAESIDEFLQMAHETEYTFGVQIADPAGVLPASLGYYELPQPIVVFVDNNGYIRMILIGRVRDISAENIDAAMDVIAEMWQWTDEERRTLPMIVALLINLLRDQAEDPEVRIVPPAEAEQAIAPTWGYPVIPEEETPPQDETASNPPPPDAVF
jgi:hypothetical protein